MGSVCFLPLLTPGVARWGSLPTITSQCLLFKQEQLSDGNIVMQNYQIRMSFI